MAEVYKVVTPLVIAKDESDRDVYVYQDGIVPENVTAASIERLLEEGFLEKVDVAGAPSQDEPPFPEGEPSEEWTGKQLDAYAQSKSIDLAGAKSKPEKVAAIAAASV